MGDGEAALHRGDREGYAPPATQRLRHSDDDAVDEEQAACSRCISLCCSVSLASEKDQKGQPVQLALRPANVEVVVNKMDSLNPFALSSAGIVRLTHTHDTRPHTLWLAQSPAR